MAAANFSRYVLEMFYGENLTQASLPQPIMPIIRRGPCLCCGVGVKKCTHQLLVKKQTLYNHCDWLKIGKNERCGKLCKQFYCRAHSEHINKGGIIPLPCLCCGVGVKRYNQLCRHCERKYGVEYK